MPPEIMVIHTLIVHPCILSIRNSFTYAVYLIDVLLPSSSCTTSTACCWSEFVVCLSRICCSETFLPYLYCKNCPAISLSIVPTFGDWVGFRSESYPSFYCSVYIILPASQVCSGALCINSWEFNESNVVHKNELYIFFCRVLILNLVFCSQTPYFVLTFYLLHTKTELKNYSIGRKFLQFQAFRTHPDQSQVKSQNCHFYPQIAIFGPFYTISRPRTRYSLRFAHFSTRYK